MTRIGNGGEQDLVRDIQRGDRVAMNYYIVAMRVASQPYVPVMWLVWTM